MNSPRHLKILALVIVLFVLLVSAPMLLTSCSRKSGEPQMFTEQTVTAQELAERYFVFSRGKASYAVINREWILWAYSDFRSWLGSGQYGVMRWDDRSQCTLFASAFDVYVQLAYFRQAFHSSIKAPGAGCGTIWYLVDPNLGHAAPNNGHALNQIITQNGREFFEPQAGRFVTLTQEQADSAFMRKFD